jgi:hypothetical protein
MYEFIALQNLSKLVPVKHSLSVSVSLPLSHRRMPLCGMCRCLYCKQLYEQLFFSAVALLLTNFLPYSCSQHDHQRTAVSLNATQPCNTTSTNSTWQTSRSLPRSLTCRSVRRYYQTSHSQGSCATSMYEPENKRDLG